MGHAGGTASVAFTRRIQASSVQHDLKGQPCVTNSSSEHIVSGRHSFMTFAQSVLAILPTCIAAYRLPVTTRITESIQQRHDHTRLQFTCGTFDRDKHYWLLYKVVGSEPDQHVIINPASLFLSFPPLPVGLPRL